MFIPVAGSVTAAGGLRYTTTLWITNPSARGVRVRISFLEAGRPNTSPLSAVTLVAANATQELQDVTARLLRAEGKLGALMIESEDDVFCSARLAATSPGNGPANSVGTALRALSSEVAIGRGEETFLAGAGSGGGAYRYNIHLVETSRSAVYATIHVHDGHGAVLGEKRVLLRGLEAMTIPISAIAPHVPPVASVRIFIPKGPGKLIAAGSLVTNGSNDATSFEMSSRRVEPRLPARDVQVYVWAAIALIVSALIAARRR